MLANGRRRIAALYRYPVKGFSPEPLERRRDRGGRHHAIRPRLRDRERPERLRPGGAGLLPEGVFPDAHEERADGRVPDALRRRDEAFSHSSRRRAAGRRHRSRLPRAAPRSRPGWRRISATSCAGAPKILSAPGFSFSDVPEKVLHLVNLASVRALEEKLGRHGRSAALPAERRDRRTRRRSASSTGSGSEIRLPGLTLAGRKRTGRCAATNVDPKTGRARHADPALPRCGLRPRGFRHLPRGERRRPHRGRRSDRALRTKKKGRREAGPVNLISSELNPERPRAPRRRRASRPRQLSCSGVAARRASAPARRRRRRSCLLGYRDCLDRRRPPEAAAESSGCGSSARWNRSGRFPPSR